jgi:hypothetical protein
MSQEENCGVSGCSNPATRITSTETKYILICDACYDNKYRT